MEKPRYYILEGKKVVGVDDVLVWGKMFNSREDRIVKKTKIGDVEVSTVFLGIDHSFGVGKPLLFETMIFGGGNDGYQERYETWRQAEAGHRKAIKVVQGEE